METTDLPYANDRLIRAGFNTTVTPGSITFPVKSDARKVAENLQNLLNGLFVEIDYSDTSITVAEPGE